MTNKNKNTKLLIGYAMLIFIFFTILIIVVEKPEVEGELDKNICSLSNVDCPDIANITEIEEKPQIEPVLEQPEPAVEKNTKPQLDNITCYNWTGNTIANGEYPYVGAIANNEYPFGTVVEIFGTEYVVKDRIGWGSDWDIYMDSYDECKQFGRRYDNVKIIK